MLRSSLTPSQVPENLFPDIESKIFALTSITSRSTKPAIYGIVAAAEVERLRPLVGKGAKSEVQILELSAARMALAAAELVAKELEILTLRWVPWFDVQLFSLHSAAALRWAHCNGLASAAAVGV